jgi:hypothetical protein
VELKLGFLSVAKLPLRFLSVIISLVTEIFFQLQVRLQLIFFLVASGVATKIKYFSSCKLGCKWGCN